jgi:hypothetical protein
MRILGRVIDERFLEHRRRSTSTAGIVAGVLTLALFEYHLLVEHVFNWELLSIGLTFAVVKLVSMLYYIRHD